MSSQQKISPSFSPFLAESGPNDKRDAIVIFRSPGEQPKVRGRLRVLKKRLAFVKQQAAMQQPLQNKLFDTYQKEGAKRQKGRGSKLGVSAIGGTQLPIASMEITRNTLPTLAEQDDVVAILPNQRIQLIRPKVVEYDVLAGQEQKDGITW